MASVLDELLQALQLGLVDRGGFWGFIGELNDNFAVLGFMIVGIFIAAWLISCGIYLVKRYDDLGASPT